MSTQQVRQPALQRRVDPLAEAIPDRVSADATAASPTPAATRPAPAATAGQRSPLDTSLQVRIQATTRARLEQAVRKLAVDRNQSVSLSGLVDEIADAYLTQHGF